MSCWITSVKLKKIAFRVVKINQTIKKDTLIKVDVKSKIDAIAKNPKRQQQLFKIFKEGSKIGKGICRTVVDSLGAIAKNRNTRNLHLAPRRSILKIVPDYSAWF
jgi:hypothetical protein